jgi:cytochrome d ubiquinol oxidase subunit II
MNTAAFVLLAGMLCAYVILDGFDLGVGALHLFISRTDRERAASFATIGPFWSGNEVVLIAAAGALFAFFPQAYAASFSGFYLPFMVALWLLMVRGLSIELRGHFADAMWRGFWDVGFGVASTLLALLMGVTIGNLLRGLPMGQHGFFSGTFAFLLNPYALGVGVFSLIVLALHGAAFMRWRAGADSELGSRARSAILILWPIALVAYAGITAATMAVHPVHNAVLWLVPLLGVASLIAARFVSSAILCLTATSVFLLALMISAAGTLYPYLLPAFPIGSGGLDIAAASTPQSLPSAFIAVAIGLPAVLLYATLAARRVLSRKV